MVIVELNTMNKYAIAIFYSDEDEGYIAVVPELPGCSAFGETEESALKEVKIAIELWLETAQKEGRAIPQPRGKDFLNAFYQNTVETTTLQKA
jgi:predicted RNase H-like HicB family nuclease